jgi:hypothetical protein
VTMKNPMYRNPDVSDSSSTILFRLIPIAIVLVALLAGVAYVLWWIAKPEPPTATQTVQAPRNAVQEMQWNAVLRAGASIRAAMRNPQSLVYDGIWANDDASLMCFQYRAQNGFGGMNKEFVVIQKGAASQSPSAWNKNCTKSLPAMDLALWRLNRQ